MVLYLLSLKYWVIWSMKSCISVRTWTPWLHDNETNGNAEFLPGTCKWDCFHDDKICHVTWLTCKLKLLSHFKRIKSLHSQDTLYIFFNFLLHFDLRIRCKMTYQEEGLIFFFSFADYQETLLWHWDNIICESLLLIVVFSNDQSLKLCCIYPDAVST